MNNDKVEKLSKYYLDMAKLVKVTYIIAGVAIVFAGIIFSIVLDALARSSYISQYISLGGISYLAIILYILIGFIVALIGIKKEKEYLFRAYMLKETHEIHEKIIGDNIE